MSTPKLLTFAPIDADLPLADDVVQAMAMRRWHEMQVLTASGLLKLDPRLTSHELPPVVQHMLLHATKRMLELVMTGVLEGEVERTMVPWLDEQARRERAGEIAGQVALA